MPHARQAAHTTQLGPCSPATARPHSASTTCPCKQAWLDQSTVPLEPPANLAGDQRFPAGMLRQQHCCLLGHHLEQGPCSFKRTVGWLTFLGQHFRHLLLLREVGPAGPFVRASSDSQAASGSHVAYKALLRIRLHHFFLDEAPSMSLLTHTLSTFTFDAALLIGTVSAHRPSHRSFQFRAILS